MSYAVGTAFAQSLGVDSADDLIGVAVEVIVGGVLSAMRFVKMTCDADSILWLVVDSDFGARVLVPWHAITGVAALDEGE